ncbi:hypothetical protein SMMN14_02761 [Sphaerulina musiva]
MASRSGVGANQTNEEEEEKNEKNEKKKFRLKDLVAYWPKLFPHRPRRECEICCERKLHKAFSHHKYIPYECRPHLQTFCLSCIRSSLSAQLDTKPVLALGCPQCAVPWNWEYSILLLGYKDRKKYRRLNLLAQGRVFVPAPKDMPEAATLDFLLDTGVRLCPWCWALVEGFADCCVIGSKCAQAFTLSYAPVLGDGHGRRARPPLCDVRVHVNGLEDD